jgi:sec-independent protein translocase protein TatC
MPSTTQSDPALQAPDVDQDDYLNEVPDDVEMSLFDHLDELRQRIFYSLIAVFIGIVGCFAVVKHIVELLEVPAQGAKFLQLSPGEYFFVSLKVAGYSGLLIASPFILYQIIMFVLLLLFSTGLAFQVPVVQLILALLGIAGSEKMLSGWRYVLLGAAILGAVLTPSTDPVTQSLLGGAVLFLYFGGIAMVKLVGR